MLQRLEMNGIELPRLYIAESKKDAELAMSKGVPFVRWTRGQDELIKILLRPVLEKMFPHIKWDLVLGRRRKFKTMVEIQESVPAESVTEVAGELVDAADEECDWVPTVADHEDWQVPVEAEDGTLMELSGSTTGERLFDGGAEMVVTHKLDISDYVGDMTSYVDLEVLQKLRLMPAFIGDILDCVRINVGSGLHWREGYNKRLGLAVGRFNASGQLPNLVILDVSGSIPRGISATMIALIDTLRTQLSADLIITGSNSRFYPMGSDLPSPQEIRNQFGYGNESYDFFSILTKNIRGKHYGHVFSFGDNDTPDYRQFKYGTQYSLEGTRVEHVHHYHTGITHRRYEAVDERTGYAKWCHLLGGTEPTASFDTSWCRVIDK